MNRTAIAAALAALADPMYVGLTRYMSAVGLKQNAVFEQLRVRELERTDDAAPYLVSNIQAGGVVITGRGTDAAMVAGTIYMSEIFLPRSMRATGIGLLNGTVVGTDLLIVAMYDRNGVRVANSALAGTLSAGADVYQEIPFTSTVQLKDGRHFLAVQANGATAQTQRIAALTHHNRAGSVAGVFGTIPGGIAVPATFTADMGPIGYVY